MKKILFCLSLALCTLMANAEGEGNYGILVNNNTLFRAEYKGISSISGLPEYHAKVSMQANDQCKLIDLDNGATWTVALDGASVGSISLGDGAYIVSEANCYDFWIKMSFGNDQLYVGTTDNCPAGEPYTPGQGGGEGGDPSGYDFYVMGWINGADAGETAYDVFDNQYKFVDGKIMLNCTMGSYIGVKDDERNYYYAEGTSDATGNSVTLKWANGWSPCQKWAIPEGVNYIIIRNIAFKGNITLELVDQATYEAYHLDTNQGIEETLAPGKARKEVINGQLRIVRGDKVFDATGRQL